MSEPQERNSSQDRPVDRTCSTCVAYSSTTQECRLMPPTVITLQHGPENVTVEAHFAYAGPYLWCYQWKGDWADG